jgi:hypothetical protein
VFGLLSAQLVLTAVVAAPIVMHSGVKAYVMTSPWVTMLVGCSCKLGQAGAAERQQQQDVGMCASQSC